jgi:hypothetical protein
MQGNFKGPQQPLSEDGVVWVQHVNHVESYALGARVYRGTKGNKQCYDSDGVDSLASEAIEGLCRLFEPLLAIAHILEG